MLPRSLFRSVLRPNRSHSLSVSRWNSSTAAPTSSALSSSMDLVSTVAAHDEVIKSKPRDSRKERELISQSLKHVWDSSQDQSDTELTKDNYVDIIRVAATVSANSLLMDAITSYVRVFPEEQESFLSSSNFRQMVLSRQSAAVMVMWQFMVANGMEMDEFQYHWTLHAAFNMHKWADIVTLLEELEEKFPESELPIVNHAHALVAFTQQNQAEKAMEYFHVLVDRRPKLFPQIVQACMSSLNKLEKPHEAIELFKATFNAELNNNFALIQALNICCEHEMWSEGQSIIHEYDCLNGTFNRRLWTTMAKIAAEAEDAQMAKGMLQVLQNSENIPPEQFYEHAMKAANSDREAYEAFKEHMDKHNVAMGSKIRKLIELEKKNQHEKAAVLVDEILERDTKLMGSSVTAAIRAYTMSNRIDDAAALLDYVIDQNVSLSTYHQVRMLVGFNISGNQNLSLKFFEQKMTNKEPIPASMLTSAFIALAGQNSSSSLELGISLLDQAKKNPSKVSVSSVNHVLLACIKHGKIELASEIIKEWKALLGIEVNEFFKGLYILAVKNLNAQEFMALIDMSLQEGLELEKKFTEKYLLNSLNEHKAEECIPLVEHIIAKKVMLSNRLYSTILQVYLKTGRYDEAENYSLQCAEDGIDAGAVYAGLVSVSLKKGSREQAIIYLKEMESNANKTAPYSMYGEICSSYLESKDIKEAEIVLEEIAKVGYHPSTLLLKQYLRAVGGEKTKILRAVDMYNDLPASERSASRDTNFYSAVCLQAEQTRDWKFVRFTRSLAEENNVDISSVVKRSVF